MSTAAPEISVVIVSWNGRSYLDACLDAVAAQQGVVTETILVDNGSTDGTADHVSRRFPWVRLVRLAENRGFAGGNNAGVREARGRYIALLNNDTVPDPGWLRALRHGIDGDSGFVLAESREVFGVCGAACLLPKDVYDELRGFDEDFFAVHEDVDLSYRARLLGYRCRYVPEAVVRHHGSVTLGRLSTFAVFHGQRNLEWLYVKNTPVSILLRTLPGHLVYTAAAAVHFTRQGMGGTFVRAKLAALAGLPAMLRKRAIVQRTRRIAPAQLWPHFERGWLATKRREKQFDAALAGPRREPQAAVHSAKHP
jgi:GT2 family glycosyltransferase